MIIIPDRVLQSITLAAEATYPEECCGLLVGRKMSPDITEVTRAVASPNVATERRHDRFEVDPRLRFDVMRTATIVGHYHSHPDHPAEPSAHDLEMAFEPDLVWLIVSVMKGRAIATNAFQPQADGKDFRRLTIRTT